MHDYGNLSGHKMSPGEILFMLVILLVLAVVIVGGIVLLEGPNLPNLIPTFWSMIPKVG